MAKIDARRQRPGNGGKALKTRKRGLAAIPAPGEIAPELATLVDEAPRSGDWIYETKYDGYRILARIQNGEVALATRNGKDFSARAPKVVQALQKLGSDGLLLDGELVSPARDAKAGAGSAGDFQALQNALREGRSHRLVYFVFDCLFLDGQDLRSHPLSARKRALARVLPRDGAVLKRSRYLEGSGEELLREACRLGFEGIIAKRSGAPYRGGRGKDWLKLKCMGRDEFVIVGFTAPGGSRSHLGALLLGTRDRPGEPLRYAGKVGTGFSESSLAELKTRLAPLVRATPAFSHAPRGAEAKAVHWVEPRLVAEISFTELTADGRLRHPSFQGLRDDKPASQVCREQRPPRAPRSKAKKRSSVQSVRQDEQSAARIFDRRAVRH